MKLKLKEGGERMTFTTDSVAATEDIGRLVARSLPAKNAFIALYGGMGAGKTALVRGIASVLSPGSRVTSPTYTLVNEYRRGPVPLFHFDLCRLSDAGELDSFGFDEYIDRGHVVVEWADVLGDSLPDGAVRIRVSGSDNLRTFEIDGLRCAETDAPDQLAEPDEAADPGKPQEPDEPGKNALHGETETEERK